jgi:hypothetical protein
MLQLCPISIKPARASKLLGQPIGIVFDLTFCSRATFFWEKRIKLRDGNFSKRDPCAVEARVLRMWRMRMFRKFFVVMIAVLAVLALACRFSVGLPVEDIATGPVQEDEIQIPAPDANEVNLAFSFGAGKFDLKSGAKDYLVSGTARYSVADFKPKIEVDGADVSMTTGNLEIRGIPNMGDEVKNEWDLELGDVLMNLKISAGAYQGDFDLGDLAIKSLEVNDGAANVKLQFSKPNLSEMDVLRYQTGASNVRLTDLANANFRSMVFRGGAGDYTLDFSGELQRDAVVTVESGISQVVIVVPDGTAAQVFFNGGLASVKTNGKWQKSGDAYVLEGSGPKLTITVDMGAGNLELRAK